MGPRSDKSIRSGEDDKTAMRPFAKLLWTLIIRPMQLSEMTYYVSRGAVKSAD